MDAFLTDPKLSLKAKGLLALLLDMQERNIELPASPQLATSDKKQTVNSALNELRKFSYVLTVKEMRRNKLKDIGLVAYSTPQE